MVKGGKHQGAWKAKRNRNRSADEPTTADPQPQPETTGIPADEPAHGPVDPHDAGTADGEAAPSAAVTPPGNTSASALDAKAAEADAGDTGATPVRKTSAEPGPAAAKAAAPTGQADAKAGAESDGSSPHGDAKADADGSSPGEAPEPAAATPSPSAPEGPKAAGDASSANSHETDTARAGDAGAAPVAAAASGDAGPAAAKAAAPTGQAGAKADSDSHGSSPADDAESTPMAEETAAATHGAAAGNPSAGADATTTAQADHAASGPVAADAAAASGDPAPAAAESGTSAGPAAASGTEPVDRSESGASPTPASPESGGAAGGGVTSADAATASVAGDGVASSAEPVSPVASEPAGRASANELSISPAFLPPAVTPVSRRRRRWKRVLVSMAVAMAVLISAAGAAAYFLYRRLDGQITTDAVDMKIGPERPPVPPEAYGAVNILLMGSDDRTGDNVEYGDIGEGTKRSDTTILLHLSADRKSSVAVSIPRDLMVQIPSCVRDDGTQSRAYKDQFNHAFEIGGSACTIKTVEQMTRVKIDHHIVLDFTGFKRMVDAVEGVEVCLSEPLKDRAAKLDLPAGRRTLDGEQALAYVRARKNLDDGSDTMRMTRQQRFLASLMHKVESNGVLFNPIKLYELLDAGTRSIAADPGLDSLDELTKLSKSVANIPSDKSAFLTVPRQPYRYDHNRDELVQPDADALFTAIRFDRIAVGKADPASPVEPGGTVEIHDAALPKATSTAGEPTGKATGKATGEPTDPATDASSDAPTDNPATADPSASATGSATANPTGSATGSPAPTGSGSAPPAVGPDASGGPIVTVTGRTVDQDVCA